ncbi:hydrogenase maturation nickel metallochaperone HypA [Pseudobutyrivibrio xylanivorans]|uniref:Hydrogenase maturation nickel metallochaperone HypA n=1 Tax=Pseudobutyrivibrio xylanivorans TaxID=185007 RepID=A0A6M0LEK4_PSEXY|nr:hydrogenase maturation nickel metallochaperone HypA [Pseudobutyrivibrio xylanivorans]NEX00353.1 hydrogenase maturation nickel metallochaperone HypA [Pseudobutyrivibrio xylanivorans]
MHELAVTEYVFNLVKKQADANKVSHVDKIHLLIGDQCDYVPEIIEEYLQVMSEGNITCGVKVDAKVKESTVLCKDCGAQFTRHEFKDACPKCGSANLKLNRCTDFIVENIEVS